jgi:hypothetical protein
VSKPLKIVTVAMVALGLGAGVWALLRSLDGPAARAEASGVASPAPAPSAPAWLLDEARRLAPADGAGRVDAAFWGVPHDPELGDLTSSGPDDPSTWAYVLVFAGDFPQSSDSSRITTESTPSPTDRMRWRLYVYDDATHELGGLGEGPGAFDSAAYPSLHSLEL